ncbi:MAG: class I SAM-dependent methyltransferase [Thermodesulfovibrionales bacterium]
MNFERADTYTLNLLKEADAYNRWIFQKMKPWIGKRILEVGCGIGNITGLLLSYGKVFVSDINIEYLQIVEKKFKDNPNFQGSIMWNITENPSRDLYNAIDTIVCCNVLEHIEDDESALKKFYQLLPFDGKLIIIIPALKILYNPLDHELGHFRRYNKSEVIKKLKSCSFKILYIDFFNISGIIGWFINGNILKRRFLSRKQIKIFNKFVPILLRLEKIVPSFIGLSIIAVGEKRRNIFEAQCDNTCL